MSSAFSSDGNLSQQVFIFVNLGNPNHRSHGGEGTLLGKKLGLGLKVKISPYFIKALVNMEDSITIAFHAINPEQDVADRTNTL